MTAQGRPPFGLPWDHDDDPHPAVPLSEGDPRGCAANEDSMIEARSSNGGSGVAPHPPFNVF